MLNSTILEELRNDLATTVLPSWVASPPRDFGKPSHGKLTADQWRTVCTVNMVITLVRLWNTASSSEQYQNLLINFVHLVVAVDLGTRKTMFPERAELFDYHMRQYLTTLRDNFGHDLRPNHHACLHLKEFLDLFGPVQGWWAFPFERYNGIIAQLKTNNKACQSLASYIYVRLELIYARRDSPDVPSVFLHRIHSPLAHVIDRLA